MDKPKCVACGKPATKRCSRCTINHYCSAECQVGDWPLHRRACTPAKRSPATTAAKAPSVAAPTTPPSTTPTSMTMSNTTGSGLPDPNKPLELKPVQQPGAEASKLPPLRKKSPLSTSTSLTFHYTPSPDGVDQNLVIFFHGLGDKIAPKYIELGKMLKLPQTATCCIQAPTPVPFIPEEAWQWYPSFDLFTGDQLGPDSPERMRQMRQIVRPELVKFLRHCIDHCGFSPNQIILFGNSQGASVALDLGAFGGFNLKAIVCIAGFLMEESQDVPAITSPLTTRVFILHGDKDTNVPPKVARNKLKYIERLFGKANTKHHVVAGMGNNIPNNETGWFPVMAFLAETLEYRNVALESMTDLYEVKQ